jgi:cathepsin D
LYVYFLTFLQAAYFASVAIGAQKKAFTVVMDTGSSDLWVPSSTCKDQACVVHQNLSIADSTSLKTTTQPWQIQYGSGSAAGVLVTDDVNIAGLAVKLMPFGVAEQLSNQFVDGVCIL